MAPRWRIWPYQTPRKAGSSYMNLGLDFLLAVGRLKGLGTISLPLSLLSCWRIRSPCFPFLLVLRVNTGLVEAARKAMLSMQKMWLGHCWRTLNSHHCMLL